MKLNDNSLIALKLGMKLQFLNWDAFNRQYASDKNEINDFLTALKIPVQLPDEIESFRKLTNLRVEITNYLAKERSYLGGDTTLLPMFYYGYLPLEIIISAAMELEGHGDRMIMLKALLTELGITGELEQIRKEIDTEVSWLRQDFISSNNDSISAEKIGMAALRLGSKIGKAWELAEKSDAPLIFYRLPLYSVFISYSTSDQTFCTKLYEALTRAGIRVWYAPHNMRGGEKLETQLIAAIQKYDKLLVVLSPESMQSNWVNTELYTARQREITEKKQVLFPISITSFTEIRNWKAFDADSGRDLAREIREYFIPDFSGWENEDKFNAGMDILLNSLTSE